MISSPTRSCPVCSGTRPTHGEHLWRLDKWSHTEPVMWRCELCNASVEVCGRDEFIDATEKGFAPVVWSVRQRRRDAGGLPVTPCDVCGGTGTVEVTSLTDVDTLRHLRCPRCRLTDRVVPVIHSIGGEPHTTQARRGLVVLECCVVDEDTAHRYCGRCDIRF